LPQSSEYRCAISHNHRPVPDFSVLLPAQSARELRRVGQAIFWRQRATRREDRRSPRSGFANANSEFATGDDLLNCANCREQGRCASDLRQRRFDILINSFATSRTKPNMNPPNGRSIGYGSGHPIPAFYRIERNFVMVALLAARLAFQRPFGLLFECFDVHFFGQRLAFFGNHTRSFCVKARLFVRSAPRCRNALCLMSSTA
jgi:hypothetical protein